jgi:hypothetical protein
LRATKEVSRRTLDYQLEQDAYRTFIDTGIFDAKAA